MYIEMEKELVDYIMNQRNEAEEFSKQPGCWMGMMPHPEESVYWTERVPTGTLKEFKRIQLEEDAYYCNADAYSKSFARSIDYSKMTDEKIEKHIERLCKND
jgi:hypothetical protein